jgi:hypothetical protein
VSRYYKLIARDKSSGYVLKKKILLRNPSSFKKKKETPDVSACFLIVCLVSILSLGCKHIPYVSLFSDC